MTRHITDPDIRFSLSTDIYIIQRRPFHSHIVVNDGYQGIRVVNPWSKKDVFQVGFAETYDKSGIINAWCLRADGKIAVVFNEESRTACWLPLEEGAISFDFECPPLRRIMDLRYFWEGDSFWITGGKSYGFFKLQWQDNKPKFVESSGREAWTSNRSWCRALNQLPSNQCNVIRVEPDQGQMIFHDFSTSPGSVGVVSWHDKTIWSAPAPEEVPRLAFNKGLMFVLHEYEIHALNNLGQIEAIYPVLEGFHYTDLDTMPEREGYPGALISVSSSLSGKILSCISLYRLGS
jgi:hypothetical protein